MSKIFVACAGGNVGSVLTATLLADSMNVVAGVHNPDQNQCLAELDLEVRPMELEDPDSLTKAMDGCDKLFLLVPLAQRMTRWGHNLIAAAQAAGVEYIVRSSGYGAASDAHWRLGREHGTIDQFVEDSGIPFTVLRPNSFMQNYLGPQGGAIREAGMIFMPEEDATVSYIDIRDIADCASALFADPEAHAGRFYALTGPDALSEAQVAETLGAAIGKPVAYQDIPEEAFIAGLTDAGMPAWNVNMLVSLTRIIKLGMMGNVTKAVEHLTGKPARSFGDFAKEYADAWK